jgi:hypothetical protein
VTAGCNRRFAACSSAFRSAILRWRWTRGLSRKRGGIWFAARDSQAAPLRRYQLSFAAKQHRSAAYQRAGHGAYGFIFCNSARLLSASAALVVVHSPFIACAFCS